MAIVGLILVVMALLGFVDYTIFIFMDDPIFPILIADIFFIGLLLLIFF